MAAMVAAGALLVGCTAPGVQRPEPGGGLGASTVPSVAPGPPGPNGDVVEAARLEAGIEDCPVPDPDAVPRADGLPELVLPCLGGTSEVDLSQLRGEPMMINVWASWCPPCRQEAPYLAEAAAAADGQLLTLGLLYDESDKSAAIDVAAASDQRYAQLVDDDRAIREPLKVPGPPVTFFVTADGRLAWTHVGPFTGTGQIRDLLAEHLDVIVPG